MWKAARTRMTVALLAASATGCLITDPVLAVEDTGNNSPSFFQISPRNDATVFLANNNAVVTFKAKATDEETPRAELVYEWSLDNGPPVQGPQADLSEYATTGAALGAGIHLVQVLVTDTGLPTGFGSLEWEVQVQ